MKKCLSTSLSNVFFPLGLMLLVLISFPFLFTGCGGGSGNWQADTNAAPASSSSSKSLSSLNYYNNITTSYEEGPPPVMKVIVGPPSSSKTARKLASRALNPSNNYLLWNAYQAMLATNCPRVDYHEISMARVIQDWWFAQAPDKQIYSTDYGECCMWRLVLASYVSAAKRDAYISLADYRPGWDDINKVPIDTFELYNRSLPALASVHYYERVNAQGQLEPWIRGNLGGSSFDVHYNSGFYADIMLYYLTAAAGDNAADRYGQWKHTYVVFDTPPTGNETLTPREERTYGLRKFVISSVSLQKGDAQGHYTATNSFTVPKNGETIRVLPTFQVLPEGSTEGVVFEADIYDSTGRVVVQKQNTDPTFVSWDGKDSSGNAVPDGKYTFNIFAYLPVGTWAEYAYTPSTQKLLSIENAKADPDDVPMPDTTTISADIVPKDFTPTNLKWKVVITQGDTEIKSFPEGDGEKVSVVWDGKNNSGDYCEFGDYTYTITATCDETQEEIQGAVTFSPPLVTVTKLKFNDSFRIVEDDGTAINRTYYKVSGGEVKKNPIAIPLSKLTAATGMSQSRDAYPISQGKFDLDMELYNNDIPASSLPNGIALKIEMHSSSDVLVKEAYATFNQRKVRIKEGVFEIPRKVQVIDAIRIKSTWVKKQDGEWVSIGKPRDDVRLNLSPEANIWITLDNPVEPIGEAQKDRVRKGLLDIACYLAEGAQTPEEARKMMVGRLHEWLRQKGFNYWNGRSTFLAINPGDNCEFAYDKFMKPLYGPPESTPSPTPTISLTPSPTIPPPLDPKGFYGQCHDVAAFYVLCCAALGMDMKMTRIIIQKPDPYRFWTNPVTTCGKGEMWRGLFDYDMREQPVWRVATAGRWAFRYHQVVLPPGNLDSVFDPTLQYSAGNGLENGFSVGVPKSIYKENIFYASGKYAPADEPIQDPEWRKSILTLKEVKWPDKNVWWPQKKAEYYVEEE